MPSGKTTNDSACIFHKILERRFSSKVCVNDIAIKLVGWQCITTRWFLSVFSLAICDIRCVGNSLVGLAPSSYPQCKSACLPSSVILTNPTSSVGLEITFRKYLPVPVTKKYCPATSLASKPKSNVRFTSLTSSKSFNSSSVIRILMLPPLRSSQPLSYDCLVTLQISLINLESINFITYSLLSIKD